MVAQSRGTSRNRAAGRGNAGNRQTQGQMASAMAKPGELIGEYPVSSVLLVFGVGLGVGFVLAQTICETRAWQPPETMAQRWGKSMYDTFSHMVPEAVSRQMSS